MPNMSYTVLDSALEKSRCEEFKDRAKSFVNNVILPTYATALLLLVGLTLAGASLFAWQAGHYAAYQPCIQWPTHTTPLYRKDGSSASSIYGHDLYPVDLIARHLYVKALGYTDNNGTNPVCLAAVQRYGAPPRRCWHNSSEDLAQLSGGNATSAFGAYARRRKCVKYSEWISVHHSTGVDIPFLYREHLQGACVHFAMFLVLSLPLIIFFLNCLRILARDCCKPPYIKAEVTPADTRQATLINVGDQKFAIIGDTPHEIKPQSPSQSSVGPQRIPEGKLRQSKLYYGPKGAQWPKSLILITTPDGPADLANSFYGTAVLTRINGKVVLATAAHVADSPRLAGSFTAVYGFTSEGNLMTLVNVPINIHSFSKRGDVIFLSVNSNFGAITGIRVAKIAAASKNNTTTTLQSYSPHMNAWGTSTGALSRRHDSAPYHLRSMASSTDNGGTSGAPYMTPGGIAAIHTGTLRDKDMNTATSLAFLKAPVKPKDYKPGDSLRTATGLTISRKAVVPESAEENRSTSDPIDENRFTDPDRDEFDEDEKTMDYVYLEKTQAEAELWKRFQYRDGFTYEPEYEEHGLQDDPDEANWRRQEEEDYGRDYEEYLDRYQGDDEGDTYTDSYDRKKTNTRSNGKSSLRWEESHPKPKVDECSSCPPAGLEKLPALCPLPDKAITDTMVIKTLDVIANAVDDLAEQLILRARKASPCGHRICEASKVPTPTQLKCKEIRQKLSLLHALHAKEDKEAKILLNLRREFKTAQEKYLSFQKNSQETKEEGASSQTPIPGVDPEEQTEAGSPPEPQPAKEEPVREPESNRPDPAASMVPTTGGTHPKALSIADTPELPPPTPLANQIATLENKVAELRKQAKEEKRQAALDREASAKAAAASRAEEKDLKTLAALQRDYEDLLKSRVAPTVTPRDPVEEDFGKGGAASTDLNKAEEIASPPPTSLTQTSTLPSGQSSQDFKSQKIRESSKGESDMKAASRNGQEEKLTQKPLSRTSQKPVSQDMTTGSTPPAAPSQSSSPSAPKQGAGKTQRAKQRKKKKKGLPKKPAESTPEPKSQDASAISAEIQSMMERLEQMQSRYSTKSDAEL